MIDVLMLAKNDWCNTGYRFSKCLEMQGLNVRFIKAYSHPACYPIEGQVDSKIRGTELHNIKAPHLKGLAEEAKVIHYIGSTFIDTGVDLNKKNVVIQHGGTTYRQHFSRYLHPFDYATIIQTPDLLGFGAKNETWISFPVDTETLLPDYSFKDQKILIGHSPSNPSVKGSKTILNVIRKLEKDSELSKLFKYIGFEYNEVDKNGNVKTKKWNDYLNVLRECDIYIEACNLKQGKKVYGEWGNTAVEAASLGKVVVTHSLNRNLYEKEYGPLALYIANDEYEIETAIRHLLSRSKMQIYKEKILTRRWVEKYHSMQAISDRLWKKVYERIICS